MAEPNDDKYALDADSILNEGKSRGSSRVKYHRIPAGESTTRWRILPWVKRRTFYKEVGKHWNIPGIRGTLTCPRSFEDENGRSYRCYICERVWELMKSDDPTEITIAKEVGRRTTYYVNAIDMDHPEEGVGVLGLQYSIMVVLKDWVASPDYRSFTHPQFGRSVIIKSNLVAGSSVPGSGAQKRNFSVMPAPTAGPVPYDNWENEIQDLDNFLGVPTYEMTQTLFERITSGDPDYGADELLDNGYVNRGLDAHVSAENKHVKAQIEPPAKPENEPEKKPEISLVPLADFPPSGRKACFSHAFDEENKICLKCKDQEECETAFLKRGREERRKSKEQTAAPTIVSSDELAKNLQSVIAGKKAPAAAKPAPPWEEEPPF